ncbi:Lipoprotein [Helicobacter ailurogastricus]|uniref:hypothetical protein n=1 Tax=Helicobacter ailurogastricus TaxID=1578720 RepID=UPI00244D8BEC|nr:hypothetical protein [Helicobacter ailurogastricus]GMB89368.1 Lipoprotein [Helicobacter ailurogastricus]GMB91188.1 Lipoprotein [Helicobacter ailurogastricus]
MNSKLLRFLGSSILATMGVFGLQACKDTSKTSSQQAKPADAKVLNQVKDADSKALNKMTPVNPDKSADLESGLEHKIDDAKTTEKIDRIVDEENAIQEATQGTGPIYTPQNNNILQNWSNHEDNLASPLNHNY